MSDFDEIAYLKKVAAEQPPQSTDVGDDPKYQIDKSTCLEDLLDENGKVREK